MPTLLRTSTPVETYRRDSYETVADIGIMLNPSAPASNFSHGLQGVDQAGNWLVSNVTVSTFMILLLLVIIYRAATLSRAQLRLLLSLGPERDFRYWMYNHYPLWAQCKKNFLYAPLWKTKKSMYRQLLKVRGYTIGTRPSMLNTVMILIYLVGNLAFCLAFDWHQDSSAIIAALRGRTGQLASLNMIPTVLFALRNNPLIFLTGVSYDTFNFLHRWAARLVVLESLAHTSFWAINNLRSGGIDQINTALATSVSFQWGMVATCTLLIIFISTLWPMRHAFYDIFLMCHRVFALMVLVGVYIHIERAKLPQLPYIQLAFAMWGVELIIRYWKIARWNLSRKTGVTTVTIEALPAGACRVSYDLRRSWKYRPGCHVHAYLPTLSIWSSHPFSVAWAENTAPVIELTKDKESEKDEAEPLKPIHNTVNRISLVCRARDGLTKRMYDKASRATGKKFTTWGFLEGPYGGHDSFSSYGTVVLFAGGIGITHCMGFVQQLIQLHEAGVCATKRVLLVWSVPDIDCLKWTKIWMDQILHMPGRRDILRIKLFITKGDEKCNAISQSGSLETQSGRCKPEDVLKGEMKERIGAMAVTACGPDAFSDSVRAAVRDIVTNGNVDFVEEAFSY